MFGDHHPSIETEFYETLLGKKQSDWGLEEIQKRYATPFIIWANYDIEEQENVMTSSNYLGAMTVEAAGVELTKYQQYFVKASRYYIAAL